MKKSTKILLTLGALAVLDLSDIAAKGQMLSWTKNASSDAEDAWNVAKDSSSKLVKVRFKMIDKVSDVFDKFC